ncbi:MAG TPA: PH domain-containing protein [Flavobacterium sp.]|nr:PH domain-containing protein [Flavobacterium sp.]
MFENNTLELNQIPKYEEVTFTNLHKDYVKIVWVNAVIFFLIGIALSVALYFIFEESEKYYFIAGILVLFSFIALFPLLTYKKKKYAFRQHDALYSSGLVFKSTHIIPYIRLQHVVIKQGWYAKRLGLATLQLHTAANDNVDVSIPGLTLEEAERWKSFLLNRLQELDDDAAQ